MSSKLRTLALGPNSFWKMPNVPGPHTSCVMSLSTDVQMLSPGLTPPRLPDLFARIFSVIVSARLTCGSACAVGGRRVSSRSRGRHPASTAPSKSDDRCPAHSVGICIR